MLKITSSYTKKIRLSWSKHIAAPPLSKKITQLFLKSFSDDLEEEKLWGEKLFFEKFRKIFNFTFSKVNLTLYTLQVLLAGWPSPAWQFFLCSKLLTLRGSFSTFKFLRKFKEIFLSFSKNFYWPQIYFSSCSKLSEKCFRKYFLDDTFWGLAIGLSRKSCLEITQNRTFRA